jgi:DNA repair protein RecN (Recombination protein N)
MLLELAIRDFAIIESLDLSFGPGLNVFTGETGAGKSIIMEALGLILGDRASNDVVRTSSEESVVEAVFDISGSPGGAEALEAAGLGASSELVIKRVVQRAGRNRIYINGGLAALSTLSDLGGRLIDIYGQGEHQSLARPEEHIEALDSFAGLKVLRDAMREAHGLYSSLRSEIEGLRKRASDSAERRDLIAFQSREITDAALAAGEDARLDGEKERLRNSGKIRGALDASEAAVYSGENSAVERLGSAIKALKEAAPYDDRLKGVVKTLETALLEIDDCASALRGLASSVEADPGSLDAVLERLDLIGRLKRKYGPAIEDVLAMGEALGRELSGAEDAAAEMDRLDSALDEARLKAEAAASALAKARRKAAIELGRGMTAELKGLGMKGAGFEVRVEADRDDEGRARLGEKGADSVSFHLSPNRGEEIKPLDRIASGGELSRVMLALRGLTAAGRVPTMVFDEIDSGVGGAVAHSVGLKLKEVSRARQVLCITHLAQIAAFADRHFSVSKRVTQGGRTVTTVRALADDERVAELSSMLGGLSVTEATRRHASELIEAARAQASPGGRRTRA